MTCISRVIWPDELPEREAFTPMAQNKPDILPSGKQIGGDHYLSMPIQPLEFSMVNKLDACQHSIMKYITRRKGDKAKRLEDIDKAMHVLEYYKQWIIENE